MLPPSGLSQTVPAEVPIKKLLLVASPRRLGFISTVPAPQRPATWCPCGLSNGVMPPFRVGCDFSFKVLSSRHDPLLHLCLSRGGGGNTEVKW